MKPNDIIKARRKELNLTLHDVAVKVGVTDGAIQRYETGYIKTIKYDRLVKLAETLQIRPAELLGFDCSGSDPSIPIIPQGTESEKEGLLIKAGEILDLFVRMSELVEQGVITPEEYAQLKQKIIDEF